MCEGGHEKAWVAAFLLQTRRKCVDIPRTAGWGPGCNLVMLFKQFPEFFLHRYLHFFYWFFLTLYPFSGSREGAGAYPACRWRQGTPLDQSSIHTALAVLQHPVAYRILILIFIARMPGRHNHIRTLGCTATACFRTWSRIADCINQSCFRWSDH